MNEAEVVGWSSGEEVNKYEEDGIWKEEHIKQKAMVAGVGHQVDTYKRHCGRC